MNEVQRQLLADELDEVGRSIERYVAAIEKLENQLARKRIMLEGYKNLKIKLEEGIDW